VNVEVISFSCGHFVRAGRMLYYLSTTWQTERNFTADGLNKAKQPDRDRRNKHVFMFCCPCISIYSFKERSTWCTIYVYLQYILSNTSTYLGRIYSPSSGCTPYGYNIWYLLLYPYGVPPDDGL